MPHTVNVKQILLLIALLLIAAKSQSIETFICTGAEETYQCKRYYGGDLDVYNYGPEYLSDVVSMTENSAFDLANPYYDENDETVYLVTYSPFIDEKQIPSELTWDFSKENEPIPWAPGENESPDL